MFSTPPRHRPGLERAGGIPWHPAAEPALVGEEDLVREEDLLPVGECGEDAAPLVERHGERATAGPAGATERAISPDTGRMPPPNRFHTRRS